MTRPTLIDFFENAFAVSTEEVGALVLERPDEVLRLQSTVTSLMADTWQWTTLQQAREQERPGELWPRLPAVVADVLTVAANRADSSLRFGRPHAEAERTKRDMQALLLYAHGVHTPSPLTGTPDSPQPQREFLHGVAQLCALAPLIRGGVIHVFEPPMPAMPGDDSVAAALEELKQHIGLALLSFEDLDKMNQKILYEAGSALVERAAQVLLSDETGGLNGTILFPTRYDRAALDALVTALQQAGEDASGDDQRTLRLDLLQQLALPGLEAVALDDMVSIRSDDSFGIFRADVATALNEVDADVRSGALDAARLTMAEHMDAGLARLNGKTQRGILSDITLTGAVTWGIGAAVAGSMAGLAGLVATLIGHLSVAFVRDAPSEGRKALRRHYVELGSSSLIGADVEDVDFSTFSTDELWGHHRGRPARARREGEILDRLLDEFG